VNPFSLRDKRFLITGATGGIGRAIALRFGREGATVLANYGHHEGPAESLASIARSESLAIELVRADLTSGEGRARIGAVLTGKVVNGLVHCAASGVHRPVAEITGRQFDFTMAVNVRGFLELVQLIAPQMIAGSSVVALSSEGAVRAVPYYAVIGSSKAALESLCRHLAVEFGPRGIRVNVLSAGTVLTPAWDAFPDKSARIEDAHRRSPTGRLTQVDEIAMAVQFLCSDASIAVNGHVLVVDHGTRVADGRIDHPVE